MRAAIRFGMAISIGIVIGVAAFLALLAWATLPSCGNDVLASFPSPNGELSAVVFDRNCGVTVGSNYQISIVSTGEPPTGGGNVLVADKVLADFDHFRPEWNGNDAIVIPIPPGARVFRQMVWFGAVRVTFRQM